MRMFFTFSPHAPCSGACSVDAAQRCPWGTSSSADGPRGTSGAGLSGPEAPGRGGQNMDMAGTTGRFNCLGVREVAPDLRGAEALPTDVMNEERTTTTQDSEDCTRKKHSGLGDSGAAKRCSPPRFRRVRPHQVREGGR
ncbi:hypothetical protein NDU88_002498 [Pleurodeles waltl]|uniref:Uncharacterized protein n=1 Tax=Pleurodeles waltl TaxID=8319 RepID=A0AAV7NHV6_PLEWA|nr:hypothetical protein NDU88_002498 [Pleurodeles waltl]